MSHRLSLTVLSLFLAFAAMAYVGKRWLEGASEALLAKLAERGVLVARPRIARGMITIDSIEASRKELFARATGVEVRPWLLVAALLRGEPLPVHIAKLAVNVGNDMREAGGGTASAGGLALPDVTVTIDRLALSYAQTPVYEPRPATAKLRSGKLSGSVSLADGLLLHGALLPYGAELSLEVLSDQNFTQRDVTLALTKDSRVDMKLRLEAPHFAVDLRLANTGVAHRYFSREPWLVTSANLVAEGAYDAARPAVNLTARGHWGELAGTLELRAEGNLEQGFVKGKIDIPESPCTALNAPFAHRQSVAAESGSLRLAAEFSAAIERLDEFQWRAKEKAFDCVFAARREAMSMDFLLGGFELVRTHDDGGQTITEIDKAGALHVTDALRLALQASEDFAFPWHKGVDLEAIESAARLNLQAGELFSGASTLTMQLSRTLYLGPQKSLMRKLEEIMIATYLEQILDKRRILELYLSVVPFGPEVYGIKKASRLYFQKDHDALSLKEAVAIVQLLPSPARRAKSLCTRGRLGIPSERVPGVLKFMHEKGLISPDAYATEAVQEVFMRPRPEDCARLSEERPVVKIDWRKGAASRS